MLFILLLLVLLISAVHLAVFSVTWSDGAAPDTAAKGGDVDARLITRVELHTLDIRKWQLIERLPAFAAIARKPKTGTGHPLCKRHINPALPRWMEVSAEGLRAFASDPPPRFAGIFGEIQAAGTVAPAGIARAQQNAHGYPGGPPWMSLK